MLMDSQAGAPSRAQTIVLGLQHRAGGTARGTAVTQRAALVNAHLSSPCLDLPAPCSPGLPPAPPSPGTAASQPPTFERERTTRRKVRRPGRRWSSSAPGRGSAPAPQRTGWCGPGSRARPARKACSTVRPSRDGGACGSEQRPKLLASVHVQQGLCRLTRSTQRCDGRTDQGQRGAPRHQVVVELAGDDVRVHRLSLHQGANTTIGVQGAVGTPQQRRVLQQATRAGGRHSWAAAAAAASHCQLWIAFCGQVGSSPLHCHRMAALAVHVLSQAASAQGQVCAMAKRPVSSLPR